jgi:pimeloyl-ACP methyl ester carboxylesterase
MLRSRAGRRFVVALGAVVLALVAAFLWSRRPDIPLETIKAHWADARSRFVAIDGMQVHYRDEGEGPPVVLIHGTSSSLHTWEGWVTELRRAHRVLRVDLPGFGVTGPNPSGDYTLAAYVRFVDAFLDGVGVRRCVLGGNSLGGNIAWEYALAHPARVRALVLVDAAGYPLVGAGLPLAFRLAGWPVIPHLLAEIDPRRLVEDGVRRSYGDPSRIAAGVVDRYYELALRPGNRVAFVERMKLPRPDHSARIRDVRAPTLLLWGGRDRVIPVEAARRFAGDIPGARLVVYDDLGHIPMEEDPARTVTDVEQFLNRLPAD